jgi:CheY-like chemotaxis protein
MEQTLEILLIEDDAIEIMKINRVLSSMPENHKIIEVNNGEDALKHLESKDKLPDIILLDLNMPKINGIEFLSVLKNDDRLKFLPTIILTTSNNPKDIMKCYQIGIAGYVVKPLKYEDYVSKITKLVSYWAINQLIKV